MSQQNDNLWEPGDWVLVKEPGQEHLAMSPAQVVYAQHPIYGVSILGERTFSVRYPDSITHRPDS